LVRQSLSVNRECMKEFDGINWMNQIIRKKTVQISASWPDPVYPVNPVQLSFFGVTLRKSFTQRTRSEGKGRIGRGD
jgi:hypothetical protein